MKLHDLIPLIPFVVGHTEGGKEVFKLDVQDMVKSLIIAGVVGTIAVYGTQQSLKEQISGIRSLMEVQLSVIKNENARQDHEIERLRDANKVRHKETTHE